MTNTKYKIEDDIPVTNLWPKKRCEFTEAIRDLKVGQSFFAPGETTEKAYLSWSVVKRNPESKGNKYTSRTLQENGVRGVRVWRIK